MAKTKKTPEAAPAARIGRPPAAVDEKMRPRFSLKMTDGEFALLLEAAERAEEGHTTWAREKLLEAAWATLGRR